MWWEPHRLEACATAPPAHTGGKQPQNQEQWQDAPRDDLPPPKRLTLEKFQRNLPADYAAFVPQTIHAAPAQTHPLAGRAGFGLRRRWFPDPAAHHPPRGGQATFP